MTTDFTVGLTKKQVREIIDFDRAARFRHQYDERRYGTSSNRSLSLSSPHVLAADPYGGMTSTEPYFKPGWESPKPTRKTLRYNYIVKGPRTKDPRRREVTVHHVAVRLNKVYCPVVKEVAVYSPQTNVVKFRDMGYHMLGGWIVYWDRKDYENHAINAWICPSALSEWHDHPCKWGDGLKFPWHETVNVDALKGTRYEWCQYADGHRTGLGDWLWLYRQEPHVENLAKIGLYQFVTPFATKALKNRQVFRWVMDHLEDMKSGSVKSAIWAAKHRQTVAAANNHFNLIEGICRRLSWRFRDERPRFDYARLGKLLPKWGVRPEEYVRYVNECQRGGLDLKNDGTLYPPVSGGRKAFVDRLERLERSNTRRERAAERLRRKLDAAEQRKRDAEISRLMAGRGKEIAAFQTSLDRVKTLAGCGYKLVLAKTQEELRKEGRRMHNCVGCGTYGRGIVLGDTLILTIAGHGSVRIDGREVENRYCVEISRRTWKVVQCYAPGNRAAPEEVHTIAESAAEALRAEFNRRNRKRRAA